MSTATIVHFVPCTTSGTADQNFHLYCERRTSIFSVEAEVETPLPAPVTKDLNLCTQTLSKALGVSLCLKGRVPKPFFDYRGINLPFDLGLTLQKNDPQMEGYEFKLKFPAAGSVSTRLRLLFFFVYTCRCWEVFIERSKTPITMPDTLPAPSSLRNIVTRYRCDVTVSVMS